MGNMQHHRSIEFDRNILPECMNLVQAIGHRMAYDAAIASGVDQELIDLYVASCMRFDPAWYVENAGVSRMDQREMESRAVDAVFLRLEEFLIQMNVEPYISAPMISDERWEKYVNNLTTFQSRGKHNDS